jgi:hypothetical protein
MNYLYIIENQIMDINFMDTPQTNQSLDIIHKIMYYIEQSNLLDIHKYLMNGDQLNINFKISEFVHILNEIWTDFIPTIELIDYETTKQFVEYIFTSNEFNLINIIRYSINRLDNVILELQSKTFYYLSEYHDFIFINQPFYDNIFIEILDEVLNYHHTYSTLIPNVYQNLLFVYQDKNNTLSKHLYNTLINLNQSVDNLCVDIINQLNI